MPMLIPADGFKPGDVDFKPRTSAPAGWLKCNGATVNRTTYAALFAAIGTTFGAGDGATTFALPDLRGEFVRGLDDGRGVDSARAIGSAQAHQYPSHAHTVPLMTPDGTGNGLSFTAGTANATFDSNWASSAAGGTSNSSETRPRNVAMLACIKY